MAGEHEPTTTHVNDGEETDSVSCAVLTRGAEPGAPTTGNEQDDACVTSLPL